MDSYFLDSSALVKRYHTEVGTGEIDRLFNDAASRFFIARLTVIEVQSGLARKVRMGELQIAHFDVARRKLFADIAQRRLLVVRMTDAHFQRAEQLIVQYGPHEEQPRLRTLDALQLAVALYVHQRSPLDFFVAADDALNAAARAEHLSTRNPVQL